ncbi:MAG: TlpA family protein disulfide reductase [Planctomycetes bacterium]|nr:TlpA family protein disulfide reductase [Planctomycetota bacterium]
MKSINDAAKHLGRWMTAAVSAAALLTGCGREAAENSAPAPAVESAAPAASVPIRLASWEETEELVADQGKVVVLDVWSTWCTPCIREFPGLVTLHEKYGDERVACMSLNCNYVGAADESPEDAREEIEAFLQQKGATFENIISTTPADELFNLLGVAAVPVVRVYDRQGNLRKQFVNDEGEYGEEGFTYEQHIAPLVDELLNE